MVLVKTGFSRANIYDLHWNDIDISLGIVQVVKGISGKSQVVHYENQNTPSLQTILKNINYKDDPTVFQIEIKKRLSPNKLGLPLLRIGKRTSIQIATTFPKKNKHNIIIVC